MLIIVMTGGPCTGRSTSAKALLEYFTEHKVSVTLLQNVSHKKSGQEMVNLQLYKAIVENSSDVVIVDGSHLNVYDRFALMDSITEASKQNLEVDIDLIAVQHDRSNKFIFASNKDDSRKPKDRYDDNIIRNLMNMVQQPIPNEGFDFIYRLRSNNYLDMNRFMQMINDRLGYQFPITYYEEVETTEEGDGFVIVMDNAVQEEDSKEKEEATV